jgi:hypothetical protein
VGGRVKRRPVLVAGSHPESSAPALK